MVKLIKTSIFIIVALIAISFITRYGINYSSEKINSELKCNYLWAKGTFTIDYFYSENGIMGVRNCPIIGK
ncbi:TPA: YobH family protein [Providencia alcalifaciens]